MRRLLVFLLLLLLLLPLPLVCQVKILMPVVAKDAKGQPVIDLKLSDFSVSGPRTVGVDNMWIVPPQTASKGDPKTPVIVLYDALDMPCRYAGENANFVRSFLERVATDRLPVTLYINSADGLRLIYGRLSA